MASPRRGGAVRGITANNTSHLLSGFAECANSIVFPTTNHVPFDSQQSGAVRATAKRILSVGLGGGRASASEDGGGALTKTRGFLAENKRSGAMNCCARCLRTGHAR